MLLQEIAVRIVSFEGQESGLIFNRVTRMICYVYYYKATSNAIRFSNEPLRIGLR
jgi:Mn2+/Fe2+ NRAMP family transporter